MRCNRFAVMVLGGLVAWVGVAGAALTPGQKMGAEALIQQLSSPDIKMREAAVEKLAALGPDAIELVNPLLKSSDAELRLRAEMILKRIKEAHPELEPGVIAPEAGGFDRVTGSLVTLKVVDADLKDILAKIAEQTGNKALVLPENWQGKPVTVDFDKTPYWKAIDQLCKMAGLVYQAHWQDSVLHLVPGVDVGGVTSYAGPVVFKVATGSANHGYWGARQDDRLNYQVSIFREDRLKPAWHEPVVVEKLTDDQGATLKVQVMDNSFPGGLGGRMMKRPTGTGMSSTPPPTGGFMLTIQGYPEGLTKLDVLTGKLTLAFAEGTLQVTIDDALDGKQKSGRTAGLEFSIVSEVERSGKFVILWATVTDKGEAVKRTDFGADERYGIWLEDKAGKRYEGGISGQGAFMGFPGADGKGRVGAKPEDLPEGARQVFFREVPEDAGALKLVLVFPTQIIEQDYLFMFTSIQVP